MAFIEAVSTNLDYNMGPDELARIKARLTELGMRVGAYRIDAIPADAAARQKLQAFLKSLEVDLVVAKQPAELAGVVVAVEDARGVYKQGQTTVGATGQAH